jgi:ADP-ribose pyrophosphatase YjhB (NUDIX family)
VTPGAKRRLAGIVRHPLLRPFARVAARAIAPRQTVGAVGALFNERGQVLIVEHAFRTDFPWGLPGGWVEAGEHPAAAVEREFREELGLRVDVADLLLARQVEVLAASTHPPHVGLAFYCRLIGGETAINAEVLSIEWCDPAAIPYPMAPFQREATLLGRAVFDRAARPARVLP